MRRPLLFLVLLCAGCGPQRSANQCSPSATGFVDPPILLTLVGQPAELELILPPAVICPGGNPVAIDVVTEVVDAQNQPVAHAHSEPTSNTTAGYSTRITFTPSSAGVHYLSARFEPALGITQRQLQVVRERSAETPWARTTLGPVCDEVLPLKEAVLCRRGRQLSVLRGGVELSTQPITGMTSAEEVGWVWTATTLTRLADADGGVERLELPFSAGGGAIGAKADRWLHGAGLDFDEVRVVDGGLVERRWSVEPGFSPITGPALGLAGEVVGWATPDKLCASAPDASVRCVESTLQPLAAEGEGLWLRGAQSGLIAQARLARVGGEPLVLFVPAQSAALMGARLSRPVFSWNGRLVAVRADDLTLEAWRSPGPVARQSVTESFVVFQLQSGETVIYRR